jgi:ComF family protein
MNRVDVWLSRLRGMLWPPTCVLCGGAAGDRVLDLCAACEADLPRNAVACVICAEPLSGEPGRFLVCGACLHRKPRFDATFCPFRYAYPLDHLVRGIKYHRAVAQGRVLSELLAARLRTMRPDVPPPDILLPVPLAARRYRERGYNQAIELARRVEKRLRIPMCTDLVVRSRETREQAALDKRERRRNIRGAFAVIRNLPARHIAIVDDVVTTGSTVNELARVLKQAGAQRVEVWAVARAGR